MIATLRARARALELATRPVHPDTERTLARRWDELPAHVKTDDQALGRRTIGCEGTHGVFPRCDLACTPCYHSRDANRVRIDGAHTVATVDEQMALLRRLRGPGQHAQLIGGEVTLLSPDDHAAALLVMRRHGRKPMSMSHGDFDYPYLDASRSGRTGRRASARLLRRALRLDDAAGGAGSKRARTRRAEPVPRALLRDVRSGSSARPASGPTSRTT